MKKLVLLSLLCTTAASAAQLQHTDVYDNAAANVNVLSEGDLAEFTLNDQVLQSVWLGMPPTPYGGVAGIHLALPVFTPLHPGDLLVDEPDDRVLARWGVYETDLHPKGVSIDGRNTQQLYSLHGNYHVSPQTQLAGNAFLLGNNISVNTPSQRNGTLTAAHRLTPHHDIGMRLSLTKHDPNDQLGWEAGAGSAHELGGAWRLGPMVQFSGENEGADGTRSSTLVAGFALVRNPRNSPWKFGLTGLYQQDRLDGPPMDEDRKAVSAKGLLHTRYEIVTGDHVLQLGLKAGYFFGKDEIDEDNWEQVREIVRITPALGYRSGSFWCGMQLEMENREIEQRIDSSEKDRIRSRIWRAGAHYRLSSGAAHALILSLGYIDYWMEHEYDHWEDADTAHYFYSGISGGLSIVWVEYAAVLELSYQNYRFAQTQWAEPTAQLLQIAGSISF